MLGVELLLICILTYFQNGLPNIVSRNCGAVGSVISEEDICYSLDLSRGCSRGLGKRFRTRLCRPFYRNNGYNYTSYICNSDTEGWIPHYSHCQPECGDELKEGEFPWTVAIYNEFNKYMCSGTIITPFHVLTAAQCFENLSGENYTVIGGINHKTIKTTNQSLQMRKIKLLKVHEQYENSSKSYFSDVALIQVDQVFVLSLEVRPACIDWNTLYQEFDFKEGNKGTIPAWKSAGEQEVLTKFSVSYEQRSTCWENLEYHFRESDFSEDKICVEYIKNNTSICRVDAGTGLFFKSDAKKYFLRGIASPKIHYSSECDSDVYGIYTKVSTYIEWIKKQIMKSHFHMNFVTKYKAKEDSDGCILPDDIQYGKFLLMDGNSYAPNTKVRPLTILSLYCNNDTYPHRIYYCEKDEWKPPVEKATCRKPGTCRSMETSISEEVLCKLNERSISCVEPENNTTAIVRCQSFFTFKEHRPIFKCINGEWDQPFVPCNPECGLKRIGAAKLIIGGTETIKNEYPWIVAIYYSNDHQICGGTIISRFFILSAAHCFANDMGTPKNKNDYTIVAGKHYRDINVEENTIQKRKIKSLFIHEDYRGYLQKYRDDIAVIELDQPFTLTWEIQPICVDWETIYEDFDFINGSQGVVMGWGNIQEGGSASPVLKKLVVPFRPRSECLKNLPPDFSYQFATPDKFCAGYKDNNTNVCHGDSGGGLYFRSDGTRFYIRGIVSVSPVSTVGCDSNHYALYTKVSQYLTWIEAITRRIL